MASGATSVANRATAAVAPPPDWPLDAAAAALHALPPAPRPRCAVLLSTGALNPVHLGHAALLRAARAALEQRGYVVLGGLMSPSHDSYVGPKAAAFGTLFLAAERRAELADLLLAEEAAAAGEGEPAAAGGGARWIFTARWELRAPGKWRDFPAVADALGDALATDARFSGADITVFYACGVDHWKKCGQFDLFNSPGRRRAGVVVVPRAGEEPAAAAEQRFAERLCFAAPAPPAGATTLSSTRLRDALAAGGDLAEFMPPAAAAALRRFVSAPLPQPAAGDAAAAAKAAPTAAAPRAAERGAPLLLAETERNRQHKCCAVCGAAAPFFCTRCHVTPYCAHECQRAHWPRHKAACKAFVKPASEDVDGVAIAAKLAAKLAAGGGDGSGGGVGGGGGGSGGGELTADWERPYAFVFVAPSAATLTTLAETVASVKGVDDADGALAAQLPGLPTGPSPLGPEFVQVRMGLTSDELNSRFAWHFSGSKYVVRGYSGEDAVALRAWSSDDFNAALPPNVLGEQLLCIAGCRGGVLVQKFRWAGEQPLPLTRREVWEVLTARGVCGALGVLTDRLTRENMRRKEALAQMREFGVNVPVQGGGGEL